MYSDIACKAIPFISATDIFTSFQSRQYGSFQSHTSIIAENNF